MNKRTSFITAAAVAGVVLAGSAAVGANIGILNAADDDNVGELPATVSVSTTPPPVEPQVIDVYIDEPVITSAPTTAAPVTEPAVATPVAQQFAVDDAGTVDVRPTETGVLLDGVHAADGWSWSSEQASETELVVTFTSADSEYVFYANLALDGTITARVDEPIVNVVQVPAPPAAPSPTPSPTPAPPANTAPAGGYDDDDDSYEDDDREDREDDEDDDDEDDDHEGGEDDD